MWSKQRGPWTLMGRIQWATLRNHKVVRLETKSDEAWGEVEWTTLLPVSQGQDLPQEWGHSRGRGPHCRWGGHLMGLGHTTQVNLIFSHSPLIIHLERLTTKQAPGGSGSPKPELFEYFHERIDLTWLKRMIAFLYPLHPENPYSSLIATLKCLTAIFMWQQRSGMEPLVSPRCGR